MLALRNYIDRSGVTITASPTALAELPTSNLKVPWFDGIARGSSAARTVSLSWELPVTAADPEPAVDLVAVLGINWRSTFLATAKWWNSGGSWSSPLGSATQSHYYQGSYTPWIGRVPRNVFVPLPTQVVGVQYWRIDVTVSVSPEDNYAWEARRLWCGPALRFGLRKGLRPSWHGTHAVTTGETAIPNVSSGSTYRKIPFAGRALDVSQIYGVQDALHDLNQLLYDQGPYAEAILLPRDVANSSPPNQVQTMGAYGRLLSIEADHQSGNRADLAGEFQEVPSPLPSPLAPPS